MPSIIRNSIKLAQRVASFVESAFKDNNNSNVNIAIGNPVDAPAVSLEDVKKPIRSDADKAQRQQELVRQAKEKQWNKRFADLDSQILADAPKIADMQLEISKLGEHINPQKSDTEAQQNKIAAKAGQLATLQNPVPFSIDAILAKGEHKERFVDVSKGVTKPSSFLSTPEDGAAPKKLSFAEKVEEKEFNKKESPASLKDKLATKVKGELKQYNDTPRRGLTRTK
jgi:hypothetical protein